MKRRALGKGLRSLIPEAPKRRAPQAKPETASKPAAPEIPESPGPATGPGLKQIDIDRIWPNPNQPRKEFDQVALEELAQSMQRDGLLQPIVVRPAKELGHYELVAGERRWRAAQVAGLLKIPAIVREVEDDRLLELALIENLQREDLNPIESAEAFQRLTEEMGLTQQEVGDRVGKDRASVANALRLLNLPAAIQQQVRGGELSAGHARALLAVPGRDIQKKLAGRVVREGLSVRRLEEIVKRLANPPRQSGPVLVKTAQRDPNVAAAEEELQRALGTKVAIVPSRKGGRLEVHYHSDEELARVYQLILGSARRS